MDVSADEDGARRGVGGPDEPLELGMGERRTDLIRAVALATMCRADLALGRAQRAACI